MLENRSFDQMLGACQEFCKELNGISPAGTPRVNRVGEEVYEQLPGAPYEIALENDPTHTLKSVLKQIEAAPSDSPDSHKRSLCDKIRGIAQLLALLLNRVVHRILWRKVKEKVGDVLEKATVFGAKQVREYQGKFVEAFVDDHQGSTYEDRMNVMRYFAVDQLPALHTLARNFTICDRWYSSVPGPTWANRFFFHSGTSKGTTLMPHGKLDVLSIENFDQRTIYDELFENGHEWRIYYHDYPQALALTALRAEEHSDRFREMEYLENDFRTLPDKFPEFVFIEPQYYGDGNDDHPPNNSMRAQQLIARVYNALRSNSDLWNESLLIVTYDEHGGFYDHEPPPAAKPPELSTVKRPDYTYDQYGVRVPAILISPWVAAGVCKTVLDHTSVGKYLCDRWALKPLGKRMDNANTFADQIQRRCRSSNETPDRIDVPQLFSARARAPESEDMNENQKALDALSEYLSPSLEMKSRGPIVHAKPSADEMKDRAKRFLKQRE
jgi:phospholipase C